jgi:hypothetical protein
MNMTHRIAVNKEVKVTALYFQNKKELKTFPKRMEFEGDTYTFLESGLQYFIKKGQAITRIFDMTDGNSTFRLRSDNEQSNWTLVAITRSV